MVFGARELSFKAEKSTPRKSIPSYDDDDTYYCNYSNQVICDDTNEEAVKHLINKQNKNLGGKKCFKK